MSKRVKALIEKDLERRIGHVDAIAVINPRGIDAIKTNHDAPDPDLPVRRFRPGLPPVAADAAGPTRIPRHAGPREGGRLAAAGGCTPLHHPGRPTGAGAV